MDPLGLLDIWVRKHATNLELPENQKKLMLADLEETGIEYLSTDAVHRAIHSDGRRFLRDILFHATIYENMRLDSLNLRGEEVTYHNGVVTKNRRHDLKRSDAKVDEEHSEIGVYQIANYHTPLASEREKSLEQFAAKLRNRQTYHELRLWSLLVGSPEGFTFTNQQVLLGYIVDFYCPGARLAIEVDGGSHLVTQDYDSQRTSNLASCDIEIMRFYNYQIEANAHKVVFEILNRIKKKLGRRTQSFAEYKKQLRVEAKRKR